MTEEQLKRARLADCWHINLAVHTGADSPAWCLHCGLHVSQEDMKKYGGFHEAAVELARLKEEAEKL